MIMGIYCDLCFLWWYNFYINAQSNILLSNVSMNENKYYKTAFVIKTKQLPESNFPLSFYFLLN